MSAKMATRQNGEVVVVDVSGRITLGEGSTALHDVLHRLLEEGQRKILLNMTGVSTIDSSGIGELVSGFSSARSRGGVVKVHGINKRVQDLLQITGLDRLLDVQPNEQQALLSFQA